MSVWVEARLKHGENPIRLYGSFDRLTADTSPALLYHHFWDEPWWEGRFVVRFQGRRGLAEWNAKVLIDWLEGCPEVDHVVRWDATPDEQHYGEAWISVARFFQVSSQLACTGLRANGQLVHCFLNARGATPLEEARFGWWFTRERLSIMWRWPLYLRRRWEAENQELLEGVRADS